MPRKPTSKVGFFIATMHDDQAQTGQNQADIQRYERDGLDLTLRCPSLPRPIGKAKRRGVFSRIFLPEPDEPLGVELERIYGRKGLAVKMFKNQNGDLSDAAWGQNDVRRHPETPIVEAAVIQNLFALDGVAPRVYGLCRIDGNWAQVTDWADGLDPQSGNMKNRLAAAKAKYCVKINYDSNPNNVVNGYWVDFQAMRIARLDLLVKRILERAEKSAAWGSRKEVYQDIPQWGVVGQRDCWQRMNELGLLELDLSGMDVLDAGCNVGTMSRLMSDAGARRVVGFDKPHIARIAAEIHALLGYWNVDAVGGNFRNDALDADGLDAFDVVLWLSQWHTLRLPDWAVDMTRGLMLFEGHVGHHKHTFEEMLCERFASVEYMDKTRDHGPRPLFYCGKDS